jgi:glucokinase
VDSFSGVDIGGTNIAAVLATADGEVLAEASVPTASHEGPEAVLARTAALVKSLGQPSAIGLGLPGTLDRTTGVVRFLPNMPGNWREVPAAEMLRRLLGIPVFLLNDARMATLGELHYGRGRDVRNLVFFTLGTGVGGGVVVDGRLLLGPLGAAGEVGHQTIVPDGPPCGCGNRGCLEALAGAPALAGEGVRLLRSGLAPRLFEITGGDASRVTPKEIAEAAADDPMVRDLVERVAGYLAIAVANLINILHPEMILLGGGVAAMGETLLSPLRRDVVRRVGMFPAEGVIIERSVLGARAGALGGVALAWRAGDI